MNQNAHTPGPWAVSNDNKERAVVQVGATRIATLGATKQADRDARLIAAAPQLLAALESVAQWWSTDTSEGDDMPAAVFDAMHRAIASARGEG